MESPIELALSLRRLNYTQAMNARAEVYSRDPSIVKVKSTKSSEVVDE